MFDKNYLSPSDALMMILELLPPNHTIIGAAEQLKIEECYGRIAASDIISREDLPGFARSTVDGYAVRSADTYGAKETFPAYIKVNNEVFMGERPIFEIAVGEAAKMPTGGMIPIGADAVVMLEHAQVVSYSMVEVLRPVSPGENVIQRDEDIRKGSVVIRKGHRLRAQDIGALAGIGIAEAEIFRKPSVSLIPM